MSFVFRKLRIKNWLVYSGDITLEFPAFEKGSNLIVVNGSNGFGKTSLLRALKFLFHGARGEDTSALRNEQAADAEDGVTGVTLEFEHNKRLCVLSRKLVFDGKWSGGREDVSLTVDGEPQLDQIEDKLIQIIPRECQQFVFFDGAEITRYALKQQEDGVKEAIERVLGIPAVRNLRDDLRRLVVDIEREQEEALANDEQSIQLRDKIDELESKVEYFGEQKAEGLQTIRSLEATMAELEREVAQVEAIEAERQQLEEKKRRRADLEESLKRADAEFDDFLKQAPMLLLLRPMQSLVSEHAAHQAARSKGPRRLNSSLRAQALREVLEGVLEGQNCLCGADLDESARKYLQERIADLEEEVSDKPARPVDASEARLDADVMHVASMVQALKRSPLDAGALDGRRHALRQRLEEIETDIQALTKQLEGHELAKVRELFEQQGEYKARLSDARSTLDGAEKGLQNVEKELEGKRRERDRLSTGTEEGKALTQTLSMARACYRAISSYVDALVAQKRADIERIATANFLAITNKPSAKSQEFLSSPF